MEETESPATEIQIKEVLPILVASIDGVGEVTDAEKNIDTLYKYLYSHGYGDAIAGPTIALFYSQHVGKYSVTVPIKEPISDTSQIKTIELPQITCLSLLHTDHQRSLDESFAKIKTYEDQHGIEWQFPVREIYVPDSENLGKYITEIQVPIQLKKNQ